MNKEVAKLFAIAFLSFGIASFSNDIANTTWQSAEMEAEPVAVTIQGREYTAINNVVTTGYYQFRTPLQGLAAIAFLTGLYSTFKGLEQWGKPSRKPKAKTQKLSTPTSPPATVIQQNSVATQSRLEEVQETPVTPKLLTEHYLEETQETSVEPESEIELEDPWEEEEKPGIFDRALQIFAVPSDDLLPIVDRLNGRYEWLKDVVTKSRLTIVVGIPGTGKSSFLCGLTGARATLPVNPHRLAIIDLHFRYGQYAPCIERDFSNADRDNNMTPLPGHPWIKHWGGGAKNVNGKLRGLNNEEQVEDILKGLSHFIETVDDRYETGQIKPIQECDFRDDPITYLWDEVADLSNTLIAGNHKEGLDKKCQYENVKIRKANVFSIVSSQGVTCAHLGIKSGFYDSYMNAATAIELIPKPNGEERPSGKAILRSGGKERDVEIPLWFFVHDEPVNYKRFFPDLESAPYLLEV